MAIVLRRSVTARHRIVSFAAAFVLIALSAGCVVVAADSALLKQAALVCGFFALVLLYHAACHPGLVWRLDDDTIALARTTVFGTRHREWPMSQVASLRVRTVDGDEWRDTFYVELRLTSGKRLRLPPYHRQGRADEIALEIEALCGMAK